MDPKVIVDPQFRSAILNFYNDQLAIIPFRQEANMDLSGGENTEIDTTLPYFPSYVVAAKEIDYNIKHIVDIQFLYDYFEPTVAILYETVQTWAG
jgi:cleavage and polyadenylation specificity factor subunit 1